MGSFDQTLFNQVDDILFRVYTDDEIKKISVLKITNDQSLNELSHVATDGIYDLRMGPMSERDRDLCLTCTQDGIRCKGHCGHIELPLPIYNPMFYRVIKNILESLCTSCLKLQAQGHHRLQLKYQLMLLEEGYGREALEIEELVGQTMSGAAQAEEVITGVSDRLMQSIDFGKFQALPVLEKVMKKYYEKVVKGGTCTPDSSTSNIKALQIKVYRNFQAQCKAKKYCRFCHNAIVKFQLQGSRFMKHSASMGKNHRRKSKILEEEPEQEENEDELIDKSSKLILDSQSYITPEQARSMLRECFEKDSDVLEFMYPCLRSSTLTHPTDMFFTTCVLVIPPRMRPCNYQDGIMMEHQSSVVLKNLVRMSKALTFLLSLAKGTIKELPETLEYILSEVPGKTHMEKVQSVWYLLQGCADNLFDGDMNKVGRTTTKGMRQVIEKKEGLFRSNLMGKRVNYSARSVAAPDPQLAVDEVGVPMDFAIRLSYPVPVTQWNVEQLRQLVINGPEKYPGALVVEDETGKKKRLSLVDPKARKAVADKLLTPQESHVRKVNATKIVYRHLMNGDYVLMNRQPTLHKPSIQAHRARVMPKDRVLRMPYANCKAYNADFDGDELNMHFPQNEVARSEAQNIITTCNQYLTPKDGSPLAGLIQDSVVAAVMLTIRGKFFSREDYQQLVVNGLSDYIGRIKLLPPAIMKPQQLWSGKQVISTIMQNIIPDKKTPPTFSFRTSVKVDMWQTAEGRTWLGGGEPEKRREAMTDSDFVMRDGELLSGVIDKSAIGSTSHGLVHVCHDLYGGKVASQLLTAVNRLFVYYLKWVGHTISVKEFVTPAKVSSKRRSALKALIKRAPGEVSKKLGIPEENFCDHFEKAHMSHNTKELAAIDAAYTSVLGPTTSEVTGENERGLLRRTLDNHMRMMVDTGAKGSKVNMNQMASLFGSVAIDGHRMPISVTGKFLPSFPPYCANPRAGGYIPDRFMTGINPQSYFYLCIVGRDSLQHTAVKTADSGYMQRCLIKHLEGIHVKYDMTVRNSDGLVLQFDYGEDGLDVTKTPFLRTNQTLEVVVTNCPRLTDPRSLTIAKSVGDKESVDKYAKTIKKWQKKSGKLGEGRHSGFLKFSRKFASTLEAHGSGIKYGRSAAALQLQDMWHDLTPEEREKYSKNCEKCPDPVKSVFSSASNLGVVSEALDQLIDQYYEEQYSKRRSAEQTLTRDEVSTAVHLKALNSMVDPGEAVGALCAQALGEPLTQMTLNTFHFAGRDELNVTLGVPRMIEVLRSAAKNISTPIMEVPFHPHVNRATAENLRIRLSQVSLSQILRNLEVATELQQDNMRRLHRRTRIRLTFLPQSEYRSMYAVTPKTVLSFTEIYFIPKVLLKEIKKSFGGLKSKMCSTAQEKRDKKEEEAREENFEENYVENRDDDDDDDDVAEDGDATTSARNKKKQEQDYSDVEEEPDDEDDDIPDKMEEKSEDEGIEEDKEEEQDDVRAAQLAEKANRTKKKKQKVSEAELNYRRENLMGYDEWISDYTFDREKQLWCEVTLTLPVHGGNYDIQSLVRQKSQSALVHAVKGIKRVFVVEKDQRLMLRTEGVNILKMFEYEHLLSVNQLYTNNIHQVAEFYGIEAAQRSIIKELRAVQSAYDIKVDFRHLTLLSDYFTCEGTYKACSRQSIASCKSPLQKMSFETCTDFLKMALLRSENDAMSSPTSNIALGQPIKLGTNSMQLLPVINVS